MLSDLDRKDEIFFTYDAQCKLNHGENASHCSEFQVNKTSLNLLKP